MILGCISVSRTTSHHIITGLGCENARRVGQRGKAKSGDEKGGGSRLLNQTSIHQRGLGKVIEQAQAQPHHVSCRDRALGTQSTCMRRVVSGGDKSHSCVAGNGKLDTCGDE